ncbi:cytochrome P450 [Suillus lakei]|nr:cytochrome P450 [Suillus lakei]
MLTLTSVTWLDLCLAGVGAYLIKLAFKKKNPVPYPPGPRGWPVIGNVPDMQPHIKLWLTFAEWGKKYGDISHAQILGEHIIVLNSVTKAIEILDKKSSIYSDRPGLPMGGDLVGWNHTLALLQYGDHFRWYRKKIHRVIGSRAILDTVYNPMVEVATHRFLKRVLAKPDQLQAHIRHTAGAIILQISYGYQVKENDDPFVDLVDRAMDPLTQVTLTGTFMVDFVPSLAKVPEWFPGAGFKRLAREWRQLLEEAVDAPYRFVKDQMAAGIAPMSFTSNLLEGSTLSVEEDHMVKWSAASLYTGGADTTVSAIYSLFLAMTLFPDAQRKAQAEIDAVVGPDRLPSFVDRDSLPYTEALVKEVLRWNAVVPTGIPHCVTEDDIHDGYYIPKGSIVIANIWFMLNDPRTYANPSQFNPERFLDNDGKGPETEPRTSCFGFGRRICPGLHLADASVWISTVMSLAVFDISKAIENGVEITPEVDPLSGLISHPKPFKCSVKPRSCKSCCAHSAKC